MLNVSNTYSRREMLRVSSLLIGSVASSSFLPISALAAGRPIEELMEALPVSERKRRILLADDYGDYMMQLIGNLLEFHIDCETITVGDTKEALEVLEQELPDLIVSKKCSHTKDVSNYYEFLSFIKQNERTREIPFISIICTPSNFAEDSKTKLLNLGVDAVMFLPFEPEEMIAHARSLLEAEA